MGRCVHGISQLLSVLWFLFCPLVLSQLPANQKTTMLSLSRLINNTSSSKWDVSRDPCSWHGVGCDSTNSSIIQLSLSGFGISNPDVLPIICQISSLESLDLSNNLLGFIPNKFINGCGGISGLKALNFSRNLLNGYLPAFTGFLGLEVLDLSYNGLTGNISLELDGLAALKSLNLSFNKFHGHVPTHLGKSMLLEQLQLSMNYFDGVIPEEIANYSNLRWIDLSVNKLLGSIPDRIGELSKLEVLILSANNLSGEIPTTLSKIETLIRFSANQNHFVGRIPSGITKFLRILDLSYNFLNGSIPLDLFSQPKLQSVDLSYNTLMGSIPANFSPSLFRLRLGSNTLSGGIPSELATVEKLAYLELDNNSLTGPIPQELGSCQSLMLLNLGKNNLRGVVPIELGNLTNLQVLKLQFNQLEGEIPTHITRLQKLSQLNISWNLLTGSIPPSISDSENLINLNLQGNKLNGSIPASIGNLKFLLELQVGHNQLSGKIPVMPPSLQIALNLSSNLFEGPIPYTLAQLSGLEVLDLSNNKFSGEIPASLTQMGSLTQLILSNNQLSGVIPKFNHWVLIEANGNLNLRNSTDTPSTSTSSEQNKKSVAAPIVIALSAAVVTLGVVTIIVLSISRRFYKINDEQSESGEDHPLPQVIQGNMLTANGIHRSKIDFTKAMEAVANPLNIVLKTRFSTYYKAIMPSGASYFVKKLNWSDKIFQLGNHDKFGQELEALGRLSNSNVMTPLAYVLTVDSAYIFYDYAQKGTLCDILHSSFRNALDWASRYSIAVGVAQGLAFLHGCSSGPILLLDLSSRNIMLKSLKEPQIGDIELCKVIDPSKSTGSLSTVAGSVGYIPPEYAYTMRVTMAGNVYSFGVILLELLTGKPAVSEGTELAKWVLSNPVRQEDHILDFSISRNSLVTRRQMLAVLKIARSCVTVSPEARPKMKSVLRMLLKCDEALSHRTNELRINHFPSSQSQKNLSCQTS